MTLNFSEYPGPYERHLQRKWRNPLFRGENNFTQLNIQEAQHKDQIAMRQFMEQFRELVQRAVQLDKTVDSDVILLLKAQLEQQYAMCAGLPGERVKIQEALRKLIAAITVTLRIASKDDPQALEKLSKDEEHTNLHLKLCDFIIVSDMLNPSAIMSDEEKISALLNESEESLQAALALFPPERIAEMIEEAKILIKKIEEDGHSLPHAWQRLAQMESWLQGDVAY